mmetsp:Transcript_44575/g.96905  ORF Transcript_44575/g.96905 Transcript_44575/m.96905 type:complete len:201 (+) Transcript_44575:669-1271(+)
MTSTLSSTGTGLRLMTGERKPRHVLREVGPAGMRQTDPGGAIPSGPREMALHGTMGGTIPRPGMRAGRALQVLHGMKEDARTLEKLGPVATPATRGIAVRAMMKMTDHGMAPGRPGTLAVVLVGTAASPGAIMPLAVTLATVPTTPATRPTAELLRATRGTTATRATGRAMAVMAPLTAMAMPGPLETGKATGRATATVP